MEAGSSDLVIDGHFMPYSKRCTPCAIDYDMIIKFESLEADSEYMIEQCHLEDVLEIKHENPAPTGPRTKEVSRYTMIIDNSTEHKTTQPQTTENVYKCATCIKR